jgi:phosphonate transport system substrate-binding protein
VGDNPQKVVALNNSHKCGSCATGKEAVLKVKELFGISYIVIVLLALTQPSWGAGERILSFGVVPQQSSSKLARKWVPIFNYISNKSGYKIIFKTAPDIPEFERRLQKGEYDLAYMNPYHYIVFNKTVGYKAFAKQKNKQIRGVLVVRKDSHINTYEDLAGNSLAFPSPVAFAASILTREFLLNNRIEFIPKYVGSHDSVYRAVKNGIYPAGGGVIRTLNNMDKSIRNQLRILWTSRPYTPHAFAAHPALPDQKVEKIFKAMKAMNDDPEAQHLLRGINFNGFEAAKANDWDDVRELKVKELGSMLSQ